MTKLSFDDLSVEYFGGRFAGTFDLEENFTMDSEVAFQVVAKVSGATMTNTKSGDLKRVNKLEVLEVAVMGALPTTRRMTVANEQARDQLSLDADDLAVADRPGDLEDDPDGSPVFFAPASPLATPDFNDLERPGVPTVAKRPEIYDERGWS